MLLFDIILLVPIAWFTFKGFTKGFIIELASLVGLVLGIYIAYFFSNFTADFLHNSLNFTSKYIQPVSFILTFIIVVVLIFILAKLLEAIIKTASLSTFNKILGAVFGFLKITLICGFCLFQLSYLDADNKLISIDTKEKSYTYKPLIKLSLFVMPLMKNVKEKVINVLHDK